MSLGVRYYTGEINVGDTAELFAALRERDKVVEQNEISSIEFTIQRPNGIVENPVTGSIEDDGQGYLQYTHTEEVGMYLAQAQFTLFNGEVRSVMVNFDVVDPFVTENSLERILAENVWFRLEDAFDSIEGGPALRDYTLAHFDLSKIEKYIPETLLDINVQMPLTEVGIGTFVNKNRNEPNPVMPLMAKGVLCKVIMHLIRSYVEQPVPQGAQIAYEDRTRYAQAWQIVYKSEHEDYISMVRLYKRGYLNLGHSALLVSSKAGRLFFSGSILRSRNIGRGFY